MNNRVVKEKTRFLPLLVLYILVVLLASTNSFESDQARYIGFANNLSQGYYSPPDDIELGNGPGYPLVLVPFVLFKAPWLAAKILNALFLFGAVLYFYYTLRLYISEDYALCLSYLLGLYPPFLRHLHLLVAETLAIFLVCGFLFHFCRTQQRNEKYWPQVPVAAAYLGYLALSKVFFGYAILVALLLSLILYLWKKGDALKKTVLVDLFALCFCLPYLSYTYSLTGKVFYWGTYGGSSLYWMTTPFERELGDWQGNAFDQLQEREWGAQELVINHGEFFKEISNLNEVERDGRLKAKAFEHIVQYPLKFAANWFANVGRLLFNYPYSYVDQQLPTYFYILPNMFIVTLSLLCIYPSYVVRKKVHYEIFALLLFALISFGGSSLLSAYARQFIPLVPIFTLWIFFTLTRTLSIEIRQCESAMRNDSQ